MCGFDLKRAPVVFDGFVEAMLRVQRAVGVRLSWRSRGCRSNPGSRLRVTARQPSAPSPEALSLLTRPLSLEDPIEPSEESERIVRHDWAKGRETHREGLR